MAFFFSLMSQEIKEVGLDKWSFKRRKKKKKRKKKKEIKGEKESNTKQEKKKEINYIIDIQLQ